MIFYEFALIYEVGLTPLHDEPAIDTGWEQTTIPDPVVRPGYYPSTTILADDVPLIGTGWEPRSPDPILRQEHFLSETVLDIQDEVESESLIHYDAPAPPRIPYYLSRTDFTEGDIPTIETGWEQTRDPDPVLRVPYYLSRSDFIDDVPPIGTGWEQTQNPDPVLRLPYFLSRTDFADDVPLIGTGWEQIRDPDPILRIPYYPSRTDFIDEVAEETESFLHDDAVIIYRPSYFLSETDFIDDVIAVIAPPELVVPVVEPGDTGFVRVRFIHFGVAHAFVLVTTEAHGHVVAIGSAHAAVAPILSAAGYRPTLYRMYGKAQTTTTVELKAGGQVVVIDDAEVMEILWLLGQR